MARTRRQLLDPVAESEIRVIEKAFRSKHIYVETEPDPEGQGLDFMYQKGVLLVGREYLSDVLRIAAPPGGQHWAPEVRDVAREVALLPLRGSRFAGQDEDDDDEYQYVEPDRDDDTPDRDDTPGRPTAVLLALDEIDRRLGLGAATPNHVLTVCGPLPPVVPCMATEPEEVRHGAEPEPEPHRGHRGERVRVYLADTGLLDGAVDVHPWLYGVQGDLEEKVDPDDIRPYAGHGTFAAGVARCTAPGIELYCANVFNIAGSALESDAVSKLTAALGQGYDIFNLTVSTSTRQSLPLLSFDAWRAELAQHSGVACVVAAGQQQFVPAVLACCLPGHDRRRCAGPGLARPRRVQQLRQVG